MTSAILRRRRDGHSNEEGAVVRPSSLVATKKERTKDRRTKKRRTKWRSAAVTAAVTVEGIITTILLDCCCWLGLGFGIGVLGKWLWE